MAKKEYFISKRTGALYLYLFSALLSFATVPHDVLSQDLEVEIRDLETQFTELGIGMSRALADPTNTGQLDQYLQRFGQLIERQHDLIQSVSKEPPAGNDKIHTTTGAYLELAGVIDGIEEKTLHRSLLRPQELDAPSPMTAFLNSLMPFTYSNHMGHNKPIHEGGAIARFFAGTALNFAASGLVYTIWSNSLGDYTSPPIEYKYMFLATMALQRSLRALFKSARYLRRVFPAMDEGYKNMVRLVQAPRFFWRPVQEAGLPTPFDLQGVGISDYFEIERLLLESLANNNLDLKLLDYQPFRSSAQTRLVEFFEDHIPEALKQGPRGRTLQSLERAAREGKIDPSEIVDQLSGFAEHEGRLDLRPLHLNDLKFWISTIGWNSPPTIRPVNAVSRQALKLINNEHSREKFDEFISKLNGEKSESQADRGIEMKAIVEELIKARDALAGLAKLTLIFTKAGSEVAKFEYEICHGCKMDNDALRTSDILTEGANSEDSWSKEFVKTISCSDMMARVSAGSR
jgi:hypothetical protein